MKPLNPALQSQIDALATLCCDALERKVVGIEQQAKPLIDMLVRNGYSRHSDLNLQSRVEHEVDSRCREISMHHRDELVGITSKFQHHFDDLVRWQTSNPRSPDGTKAANISSARDA